MRTRYVDIDDRMEDLAERMRADPELATEFRRRYELSWLYHENALEGVVYSSQELTAALAQPILTDATFVSSLLEIRNHKVAMDLVREEAKAKRLKLSPALSRRLYETLGKGIEGRSVAEYRKDMPLHRAYFHDIAQPARIVPQLQRLFDSCDTADFRNAHAIQRASRLHHGFMQAFPYTENSGRVGRLLANLVLLHSGLKLPVIIHATDRQRYYESLRLPEAALRDFMLESMENGIANGERFIQQALAARAKKAAR